MLPHKGAGLRIGKRTKESCVGKTKVQTVFVEKGNDQDEAVPRMEELGKGRLKQKGVGVGRLNGSCPQEADTLGRQRLPGSRDSQESRILRC